MRSHILYAQKLVLRTIQSRITRITPVSNLLFSVHARNLSVLITSSFLSANVSNDKIIRLASWKSLTLLLNYFNVRGEWNPELKPELLKGKPHDLAIPLLSHWIHLASLDNKNQLVSINHKDR